MIAEGQDFLRSKGGMGNTYLRGDLNALDYKRLYRHLGTHAYFADWIAFRKGARGRLLRHFSRPTEGYFRFFSGGGAPLAVVVNADQSKGPERLLYAINPTAADATIGIGEVAGWGNWRQIADHERFLPASSRATTRRVEADLEVPSLGCGLWLAGS